MPLLSQSLRRQKLSQSLSLFPSVPSAARRLSVSGAEIATAAVAAAMALVVHCSLLFLIYFTKSNQLNDGEKQETYRSYR